MARATARATSNDEWVYIDTELTVPPKKQYNPGTLFKRPTYSFDNAADFQDLTPEQIVTTELYLINPKVDAGKTAVKNALNEQQREALLRLMAIKKVVDTLPKKDQEKVRLDLITKYEISRGKEADKEVERLLDEAAAVVFQEENEANYDAKLGRRVAQLKTSGGKITRRRVSKTHAHKIKTRIRKSKTRVRKSKTCKSKTRKSKTRKSKRHAIKI